MPVGSGLGGRRWGCEGAPSLDLSKGGEKQEAAEALVLEFSTTELPERIDPGSESYQGREGGLDATREQASAIQALPLDEWLGKPPAQMYALTQRLEWNQVIAAVQELQRRNPAGHLDKNPGAEGLLRAHLCTRLQRLFSPHLLLREERLRNRAVGAREASIPPPQAGIPPPQASTHLHSPAPGSDYSQSGAAGGSPSSSTAAHAPDDQARELSELTEDEEWSGGREAQGRPLSYPEGALIACLDALERAKRHEVELRLLQRDLANVQAQQQQRGPDGSEEQESSSQEPGTEAGAEGALPIPAQAPCGQGNTEEEHRTQPGRAAKEAARRKIGQHVATDKRGERQDERASEREGKQLAQLRSAQEGSKAAADSNASHERPRGSSVTTVILERISVPTSGSVMENCVAEVAFPPVSASNDARGNHPKQTASKNGESPHQPAEVLAVLDRDGERLTFYDGAPSTSTTAADAATTMLETLQAAPLELAGEQSLEVMHAAGSTSCCDFLCDSGTNPSLSTRPVAGAEVTCQNSELAHGALRKGGFTISMRRTCTAELLDGQGQVALSAPLEVAVASCDRRNIFSASQVIREWGAFPDLQHTAEPDGDGRTQPLEQGGGPSQKAEAPYFSAESPTPRAPSQPKTKRGPVLNSPAEEGRSGAAKSITISSERSKADVTASINFINNNNYEFLETFSCIYETCNEEKTRSRPQSSFNTETMPATENGPPRHCICTAHLMIKKKDELPASYRQIWGSAGRKRQLGAQVEYSKPLRGRFFWMGFDTGGWKVHCAGVIDGAILETFRAEDACEITSGWPHGWRDHCSWRSPGSYVYVLKIWGKDGFMHSIVRRMQYAPHLPLPYVLSHGDEERREGSIICTGTKELKTRGGAVIELTIPRATQGQDGFWNTPTCWVQVKPVNHPGEQQQLQLIHEREQAEAEATATTGGYGTHLDEGDGEEWSEQEGVSWHDDVTWGWAFIHPDAEEGSPWHEREPESAPDSPPDSPQPAPEPEEGPASPSYSPQLTPEPEAGSPQSPRPELGPEGVPASPSYSPQPSPEPE